MRIQVRATSQTKVLEVFFSLASHGACEARNLGARKTLTPHFTDLFTDFDKKPTVLQSSVYTTT